MVYESVDEHEMLMVVVHLFLKDVTKTSLSHTLLFYQTANIVLTDFELLYTQKFCEEHASFQSFKSVKLPAKQVL